MDSFLSIIVFGLILLGILNRGKPIEVFEELIAEHRVAMTGETALRRPVSYVTAGVTDHLSHLIMRW